MIKVFLGGTCNDSTWRDKLIPKLKVSYFNPVVKNWTPECQQEEIKQREECDVCLYVITPKMTGVYSIAEIAEDSVKRPEKTVFAFLPVDKKKFSPHQLKALTALGKMVTRNGGVFIETGKNPISAIAKYLNQRDKQIV
jgi:hypothetical protein